jgi:hypothetical protein
MVFGITIIKLNLCDGKIFLETGEIIRNIMKINPLILRSANMKDQGIHVTYTSHTTKENPPLRLNLGKHVIQR